MIEKILVEIGMRLTKQQGCEVPSPLPASTVILKNNGAGSGRDGTNEIDETQAK
jgi:hypothetical protein